MELRLDFPCVAAATRRPRRLWDQTNWNKYDEAIFKSFGKPCTPKLPSSALSLATTISKTFQYAIDQAVPIITPKGRCAAWWTPNLTILKKNFTQEKSRLRKKFSEELERCHKFETAWSKAAKKARSSYWDKHLSSSSQTDIWKTIKRIGTHKKSIPPLLGKSNFNEKCALLRSSLFPHPQSFPSNLPTLNTPLHDLSRTQNTISPEDVTKIIKKAKDSSAPGYDGISYKFIAHLHQLSPTTFPLLYNSLLIYNVYPADWKRAICVITSKKGKQSYLIPSAYRPISFLPCIAKVMEAILAKQIETDALLCGALSPYHMGVIKQTSAINAVIAILNLFLIPLAQPEIQKQLHRDILLPPLSSVWIYKGHLMQVVLKF
jgi:hypothetical protein